MPGSSTKAGYKYLNIAKDDPWHKPTAGPYDWSQEELIDQDGIPGQNNTNPRSIFRNHFFTFVKIDNKYYDPSYGVTYDKFKDFEDTAVSHLGAVEMGMVDGVMKYIRLNIRVNDPAVVDLFEDSTVPP